MELIKTYLKLAFTSLKSRKLRSWLTIIGVFIGIAAIVALISLGQGLRSAVVSQFASLGYDRITVEPKGAGLGPPGQAAGAKLTEDDLDVLKDVSGVEIATARLIKSVSVKYNDNIKFVMAASLPDDNKEARFIYNTLGIEMFSGKKLDPDKSGEVLLGYDFTDEDKFGKPLGVGRKIKVQDKKFKVAGVMDKGGIPMIDFAIFMNEEDMRELLEKPEEYSMLFGKVEDRDEIGQVVESVERDLRDSRGVEEREEDFTVSTAQELLDSLDTILNVVEAVLIGIAFISLIVGGINIMNTMYTSVLERTKEIGIMKAVGARNTDVLFIFLVESGLLGMIGGVAGVIVGVAMAKGVEVVAAAKLGVDLIDVNFSFWLVGGALLFSFLVGALSGAGPAYQASNLQPVEAISDRG